MDKGLLPKKTERAENECEQGHHFIFENWKVLLCSYHNESKGKQHTNPSLN